MELQAATNVQRFFRREGHRVSRNARLSANFNQRLPARPVVFDERRTAGHKIQRRIASCFPQTISSREGRGTNDSCPTRNQFIRPGKNRDNMPATGWAESFMAVFTHAIGTRWWIHEGAAMKCYTLILT